MQVWAFDCEWVPDIASGRRVYHISPDVSDEAVLETMWKFSRDYDPERNPQPFVKTILCRLVSIAAVVRDENGELHIWTSPFLYRTPSHPFVEDALSEKAILQEFLGKFEENLVDPQTKPILVGYNSRNSDLHILYQRALVNGLQLKGFHNEVSAKPWNQSSVDLMDLVGGLRSGFSCSLNEISLLCGFPGKLDTAGGDVANLYYRGNHRKIVEYNVFDALTTYLLWLRCEYFKGTFTFTPEAYEREQQKVRDLIEVESKKVHGAYLNQYLEAWDLLRTQGAY